MPYDAELQESQYQLERLMDIATTLADFTYSAELAAQIPAYLSRVLELEPITLAVLHQSRPESAAQITLVSCSDEAAGPDASSVLGDRVLDIHSQMRPSSPGKAPMLRSPFSNGDSLGTKYVETSVVLMPEFPRALVFARPIDDQNQMYLILHRGRDQGSLAGAEVAALALVANQLAKLLHCVIDWQDRPGILGSPFERLTGREWMVLRGLNSEEGEKQLADRLQLSPHTLHSHIKSIYRKVGVQGRLPLLQRLNAAVRGLRSAVPHAPAKQAERSAQFHAACGS